MPHECTACGRTFPDGSKEMLSGCPDCGGTKFQFQPRAGGRESADTADSPDPSPEATDDDATVTGRAWPTHGDEPSDERRVRGRVGSRARTRDSTADGEPSSPDGPAATEPSPANDDPASADDDIVVADEEPLPDREDAAQADARSGIAAPDEVTTDTGAADAEVSENTDPTPEQPADAPAPADDEASPDLSALRKELNDQFESIRIVSPGQYELNLMELYEREEHIISLREDGRYVIEVPESWRDAE